MNYRAATPEPTAHRGYVPRNMRQLNRQREYTLEISYPERSARWRYGFRLNAGTYHRLGNLLAQWEQRLWQEVSAAVRRLDAIFNASPLASRNFSRTLGQSTREPQPDWTATAVSRAKTVLMDLGMRLLDLVPLEAQEHPNFYGALTDRGVAMNLFVGSLESATPRGERAILDWLNWVTQQVRALTDRNGGFGPHISLYER